jgi:hypothetical protein
MPLEIDRVVEMRQRVQHLLAKGGLPWSTRLVVVDPAVRDR